MGARVQDEPAAIEVDLLDAAAAGDGGLVDRLAALVNGVYTASEAGLWQDGSTRTTAAEVARKIGAREMAIATVAGHLAGAVHVHQISGDAGEFGMLAADGAHQGIGVGRALVAFAEAHIRDRGLRAMQLELLVPLTWRHPSKVFLDRWYTRLGYRVIRTGTVEAAHPQLAPRLATECELLTYEKPLGGG